ncbi:hypothetical protein FRACYDRAFT_247529 [Fragilariopsis cylindrus CCMP1102]|uniref:Uncharacterized protein n=1 Tax=Fragilariopsis cylindrus CCMP1102 TaxID=635003 RepID=A0A1E7EX71_9STRA|nr:hypothetical protein FRACYDRAFT_247529 [Fragilariopsis cylindrus CCMP1102]|eukprot:OEU10429.1 hypothetical protein FRACYDRAFT_247529 [Fragilariopsis cylindrus CCMP1102]
MYWYGNPSNDLTTPPSAISKVIPAHVSQRLAPGPWRSLRDHITDLEHQLRTFQQSQQRQTELEEKSLLEQELDQLARLTKEQEENAQLAIAAKKREESYHSCNDSSIDDGGGGGGGGGDSVDTDGYSNRGYVTI